MPYRVGILGGGNISETHVRAAIDAREGRRSVAVVEAIYASARSGCAVRPP